MSMIDPNSIAQSSGLVDYKAILNPEQYEAASTTEGPVLIIAGAGTGKTNTLVKRVMYLISEKHVPAERILLLTFTNKAAREMLQRADAALNGMCKGVKGCTYHSFCANLLRKYAGLLKMKNNFTIYDTQDSKDAFNLCREKIEINKDDKLPNGGTLIEMHSYMVNKGRSINYILENVYPEYRGNEEIIKKLFNLYKIYKKDKNAMDYDDLLIFTAKLLEENPNIARSISDAYRYIMVDEYQDSNALQLKLLTLLRQFDNKNICVVGDDFQSIYGFRGAEVKNILNFPQQFTPCKVITLYRNYRSSQQILDLANQITLGAKEKYDKELKSLKTGEHKPYLIKNQTAGEEASYVRSAIAELHNNGTPYSDIAVLARSSYCFKYLEALLNKNDGYGRVPYVKYGGIKFMERAVIKDIFAYIRLLVNTEDELAWFRTLQIFQGLGATGARKLATVASRTGVDALIAPDVAKKKYAQDLKEYRSFYNSLNGLDLPMQLERIIGYYAKIKGEAIAAKKSAKAKDELRSFKYDIEDAEILLDVVKGYKNASEFLADMTLESAAPEEKDDDKLVLSTIHSAKGLEFGTVFILDCVEGVFPKERPPRAETEEAYQEAENEMEEERRAFYVAVTRAKDNLYLMAPLLSYTGHEIKPVSRFLNNCNDLLEIEDYTYDVDFMNDY